MSEPCRCERADAITSLVAISRIVEKVSAERDAALATIERVKALCDGYDLASAKILAALEPTPKGKP